ncbi:hypothetical protein BZZ01_18955 [Nostocales cyanobacterium HT-58-2]|nr:hypothetical protein BZZ01_18955 [Nostocales cyanobacterium HT-58-2]
MLFCFADPLPPLLAPTDNDTTEPYWAGDEVIEPQLIPFHLKIDTDGKLREQGKQGEQEK